MLSLNSNKHTLKFTMSANLICYYYSQVLKL
jgi:hypothetical protein